MEKTTELGSLVSIARKRGNAGKVLDSKTFTEYGEGRFRTEDCKGQERQAGEFVIGLISWRGFGAREGNRF
jgi:hypothetical protein